MKGNNGSGNTIKKDEWETPQWLFDIINKQYKFQMDCCANKKNTKCFIWSENFEGVVMRNYISWMNPPFSKSKLMFEQFFKIIEKGIAIYRSDNLDTQLWQDIILKNADWVFFFRGRINYEGMEGKGSRFPSALIGVGLDPVKNLDGKTMVLLKDQKDKGGKGN